MTEAAVAEKFMAGARRYTRTCCGCSQVSPLHHVPGLGRPGRGKTLEGFEYGPNFDVVYYRNMTEVDGGKWPWIP
jgi:hypothetical protein